MRPLLFALLASAATPALAQHSGHSPQQAPPASSTCTAEHAAMGHCTMPPPKAQPTQDPHAGHQMPAQQQQATDPHAGHVMPAHEPAAADPHAGHVMDTAPAPPKAPPPPAALTGPEHAADSVFGAGPMAASREEMRREHGALPAYRIFIERAETRVREGRDGYLLDAQAWHGGDIDKLWFKGEIEGNWDAKPERAEVQALWSHAIDPWFDVQAGVRADANAGPDRAHLVLGVQGLAPYWWEVDGAVFLSNEGEITARAEAEHDLRITRELILQPRGEIHLSLQDIPELRLGTGITSAAAGLRLRYQVTPLFAPYAGVEYERAFGSTRRLIRGDGEDPAGFSLVAGLRFWF